MLMLKVSIKNFKKIFGEELGSTEITIQEKYKRVTRNN